MNTYRPNEFGKLIAKSTHTKVAPIVQTNNALI